jgi:hypothetical protein
LALTQLDGLSGAGIIDGVLPVELGAAAFTIAGGRLTARAPGWLRYRADAVPTAWQGGDAGVTLLLQALENFRYDQLEITLDGATDASMVVGLAVRGANPDLYDGHPIELDVDLEGELASILQCSLSGYRIPRQIEDAMARFAR